MTTINLSRIQPNRIYKVDDLLIKLLKISKNSFVTLTATNNVEEMVTLVNRLKFIPNSPRKVFFPAFTLNVTTLKPLRNTTARETKYRELKEHKLPFNRLVDLGRMQKLYDGKPVILDMSIYREAFNTYFNQHKKKPASSLGLLKKSLDTMIQELPKDRMTYTLVDIGDGLDSYLQTLVALIRFSPKEAVEYLNKLRMIFYTRNGFMYFNPAYKIADKAKLLSFIEKLEQYSTAVTEVIDSDVYVVTEKDLSTTEVEDVQLANKLVVDVSDSDQHHLDPDVDDGSGESETVNTSAVAKDDDADADDGSLDDATTDAQPEESIDEFVTDKTEAEVDEDLKAIVDNSTDVATVSTADLREKIKKDNDAFMAYAMPLQTKALAELEKEADALAKDLTLDTLEIPDETILNTNFKTITGGSITQSYYKKQFKKDVLDIFKTLNDDPEYPMAIMGIKTRDSSTALTKSQELSVELMDKRRRKTTFKVDVPLLSRDGFILYNGNKKFIAKQALPIPVIKETEDRVQITTNYKKTFLYRKGEKTSGQGDRILRVLLGQSFSTVKRTLGNSTTTNLKYPVSIAYNYLARKIYSLTIKSDAVTVDLRLNQQEIRDELAKNEISIDLEKFIPVGYAAGNVICEDVSTRAVYLMGKIGKKVSTPTKVAGSLIEYLTTVIQKSKDTELLEAYKNTKPSVSLSYTQIKIASKDMALGALIAMYKGLLPALELYKINYRVEEKRVAKKDSEVIFGFKDVYLYVDTEFKPEFEIFINGLSPLNTSLYSIGETGIFAPIFMDYLEEQTGSRNTAKALANFESSMIDPITKETLVAYKLPTNFPELLLYGNTLLGGFGHDRKNDMSHFRLRDSEVIAVAVYNTLMNAYNDYKRTMRSNIPQSINVRKDAVFRALQDMNNVEDYSTLNPFQEAEIKSKATFKGPSGLTQ